MDNSNDIYKVLFVCHGNICRSPMAERVMRQMVAEAGLENRIAVGSAATSSEEEGNPIYPPARAKLAEHGIDRSGHAARRMTWRDYDECDLLIGMDDANVRNMERIAGGDMQHKIHRLLDFTSRPGAVADPWYTDDFETTWQDVELGCRCLLNWIINEKLQ
ncbi:MAG: low molecular weight phosphotyrosine protein phosphatase [Muribaculaceae bacterium]|nr:low molecular weight phosphotyrosine protein phosphatase [Muribaculaceae bacterium]